MEPCSFASSSETALRKGWEKPKANLYTRFKESSSAVCGNSWTEMKGNEACLTCDCSIGVASWEVASHCQPFCWGHFYPTFCPPFVLLEELEGILVSFTTPLHAWVYVKFWTLPAFMFITSSRNISTSLTQSHCLLQLLCTGKATLNWSLLTKSNHAQNKL